MFVVGDYVKYMEPLDHDFTYGIIRDLKRGAAMIEITSLPGKGKVVRVAYRHIYKMRRTKSWEFM